MPADPRTTRPGFGTALALCDIRSYVAHIEKWNSTMAARSAHRGAAGGAAAGRFTSVLNEARRAGLLDGDKSEHVSFRAPPALIEAARRESGVSSPTELGILALALLALPDPVAIFMERRRGALGKAHSLEY
jgi:hypothetical protein